MRASLRPCLTTLVLVALLAAAPEVRAQIPGKAQINTRALKPDLEVTLEPSTAGAAPARFIVRNTGLAAAPTPSLLTVSFTLLPLSAANLREYERVMGRSLRGDGRFADACRTPIPDFQAAIGPLEAGASQVASPPAPTVRSAPVVAPLRGGGVGAAPEGSSVRSIQMRFRCVYEVRVEVDANRQVTESDERNNAVVHRFQREATVDLLRYDP